MTAITTHPIVADVPELFLLGRTRCRLLVRGEQTAGEVAVVDGHMPAGDRVPLHRHREEDETFIVLEGRTRFLVADEIFELGPGQAATVPRGAPHAYRVLDDGPARWLTVVAPARFDAFVAELGRPVDGPVLPEPTLERVAEVAARHGIEILGPPPAELE